MNALINVIIKCVATNEITRLVHKIRGCCFVLQFESVDDVLSTISGFIVFFSQRMVVLYLAYMSFQYDTVKLCEKC